MSANIQATSNSQRARTAATAPSQPARIAAPTIHLLAPNGTEQPYVLGADAPTAVARQVSAVAKKKLFQ